MNQYLSWGRSCIEAISKYYPILFLTFLGISPQYSFGQSVQYKAKNSNVKDHERSFTRNIGISGEAMIDTMTYHISEYSYYFFQTKFIEFSGSLITTGNSYQIEIAYGIIGPSLQDPTRGRIIISPAEISELIEGIAFIDTLSDSCTFLPFYAATYKTDGGLQITKIKSHELLTNEKSGVFLKICFGEENCIEFKEAEIKQFLDRFKNLIQKTAIKVAELIPGP